MQPGLFKLSSGNFVLKSQLEKALNSTQKAKAARGYATQCWEKNRRVMGLGISSAEDGRKISQQLGVKDRVARYTADIS